MKICSFLKLKGPFYPNLILKKAVIVTLAI